MIDLAAASAGWTIAPTRHRRPEDVEQLLRWTYAQQKADVMLGHGLAEQESKSEGGGFSGDGVIAVERIGRLGCRIQSCARMAAPVHPDAVTIHDAVMSLERPTALLLMHHARLCSRPDDGLALKPRFAAKRGRKGNPLIEYAEWDRHKDYGHCPIVWLRDVERIEKTRALWRHWRQALVEVGLKLLVDGKLLTVTPTGPQAKSSLDLPLAG